MNLFCTTCDKLVETDEMVMVRDWPGRRGKANVAIFRDGKSGAVHTVLNEMASERYRPKPQEPETRVVVIPPEAGEAAAPVPEVPPPEPMSEQTMVVEDWSPSPEEWFAATVDMKAKNGGFLFLGLSNGEQVFCSIAAVPNRPNGHLCLIQPGDSVTVRITENDHVNTRWKALEAVLQNAYDVPPREEATIKWWSEHYGVVIRPCGCHIFVTVRDSISLREGDAVTISGFTESTSEPRSTIATEIEITGSEEEIFEE